MTLNTFTAGVNEEFSTELNENFNSVNNKILYLYNGTGLNITRTTTGTTTAYLEPSILASDLVGKQYIYFNFSHITHSMNGSGAMANNLKLETKDIGGAYVTDFDDTLFSGSNTSKTDLGPYVWVHTLTANEIANGLQVKISSTIVNSGSSTWISAMSVKQVAVFGLM